VTVCPFARDFDNFYGGIMEGGENVGGSSRSGRIATTRHRLCSETVYRFARDSSLARVVLYTCANICGRIFLERGIFTHFIPLLISAIPFRDMTSGVTVETVGDDSLRVVTTRRTVTIRREPSPLLRPVTDRVHWT